MSTFTMFNGPQGAAGPSTKDITSLISAYNELSIKLTQHIAEFATSDGSTVHAIKSYVDAIKNELEATITTKADSSKVGTVALASINGQIYTDLSNAVNALTHYIESKYAKATDLVKYVPSTSVSDKASSTDKLQTASEVKKSIDALDINKYATNADFNKELLAAINKLSDGTFKLLIADIVQATNNFVGLLHAHKVIDFTKWAKFSAPFAGTGSLDTNINGVYILGCISLDWSDDSDAPNAAYAHKAGRAYIKYVNSNPFDAIIDFTVTKTDESHIGSLTAHVSKKAGTWEDLAFHLILGTDSKGNEHAYVAVSSKGLASSSTAYSNTDFRACGENFIPVGEVGYATPSGMLEGITTATIGTNASSITAIDNLILNKLWSDNYMDAEGSTFLKVVATNVNDKIHRQLVIGDNTHDDLIFAKRPSLIIEDRDGNKVQAYFVTTQDIANNMLPVGAIIRWAAANDDGSLRDIPDGWLDISVAQTQVSSTDYPDLAKVLGTDIYNYIKMPVESHSIIKAKNFDIIDQAYLIDYNEVVEITALDKKINKEITRAQTAETTLNNHINDNTRAISNEATRAIAAEKILTDDLAAETTRAKAAEQANKTAIDKNATAISNEATRAIAAEKILTDDLAAETTRAKAAEKTNTSAITAERDRAASAEQTLNDRISGYHTGEQP